MAQLNTNRSSVPHPHFSGDTSPHNAHEQLVFSGGGARCFWQGGFLRSIGDRIDLRPKRISGVSGGALAGATYIADREQLLLEVMGDAFAGVERNFRPGNAFNGGDVAPHQQLYRDVVATTLDSEAERKIADGPPFQVLIARPPSLRLPRSTTLLAELAYLVDRKLRSRPRLRFPQLIGVTSEMVDARAAARRGQLVDLVCHAAVIPPIFGVRLWDNCPVIDGSLVDHVPMPDPDSGSTLVLLTGRYSNLPISQRVTFAHPSKDTPVGKLDFSDREKLRATWQLGVEDGKRFVDDRRGTVTGEKQAVASA